MQPASSQLVLLTIDKVLQEKSYAAILLQSYDKKFVIYIEPIGGRALQTYLKGEELLRPSTFDMITSIFQNTDIAVKQVVINDVQDTLYFAKLFIEQKQKKERKILEIDVRPSDGIILATACKALIYCTYEVLQKIISVED